MQDTHRCSGLDLLRIFSMLLITAIHFVVYSKIMESDALTGFNRAWLAGVESIMCVGVNSFAMITGYFECEKHARGERLFALWFRTVALSIVLFAVMRALGVRFSGLNLLKTFLPISGMHYWYLVTYFALLIASPLLNLLVAQLGRRAHLLTCVVGFLMLCVYFSTDPFIEGELYIASSRGLIWFFYLYLVAAYFREYGCRIRRRTIACVALAAFCALYALNYRNIHTFWDAHLTDEYSALAFLLTICVFLLVKDISVRAQAVKRAIGALAACSVYVYLIQENEMVRRWYWDLFRIPEHAGSGRLILLFFASLLALWPCALLAERALRLLAPLEKKLFARLQASAHRVCTAIDRKI